MEEDTLRQHGNVLSKHVLGSLNLRPTVGILNHGPSHDLDNTFQRNGTGPGPTEIIEFSKQGHQDAGAGSPWSPFRAE